MRRSLVHLLTVFAERMGNQVGDENAGVKAIRLLAKEYACRRADGRGQSLADEKRIERQRTLVAMLTENDATERLKDAMLQRAYDLMWDGAAQECDAIAEFLPSADVERMFAAWDSDTDEKNPRSEFWDRRGA